MKRVRAAAFPIQEVAMYSRFAASHSAPLSPCGQNIPQRMAEVTAEPQFRFSKTVNIVIRLFIMKQSFQGDGSHAGG